MEIEYNCSKYLKNLGRRVRELRSARGWTLEETEEHGWPSWRHLQKIEAGKNITVATLWKLAKLFKVPPSKILEDL